MFAPHMRLIIDPPLPGPANMARDEALLTLVGKRQSPPTLRLYQWDPPTISLGYFQRYADYELLPPPAGDLAVVRRLTGGGAILHDYELTYSITIPVDHPLVAGGPNRLYELAHDALIDALAKDNVPASRGCQSDGSGAARGPFFCFERRHCLDVLIGADKLAGSAQRRTKTAILQHGSIILTRRFNQQPAAALIDRVEISAMGLGRAFAQAFATRSHDALTERSWSSEELDMAESLTPKYAGREWTKRT